MARTVLRHLTLNDVNDAIVVLDRQIEEVRELVNKVRSGSLPFTGDIDLGGNRLTNLSNADTDNDALTLGELVDRLDDLEAEAAVLETTGAEDYSGGGRQKRLRQRTSRLKDLIEDTAANVIATLGFPAVVFTQDDGTGNAELATDTTNFVWDDTNNRLGLLTSAPSHTLHVATGGAVRIQDMTAGSVLFAGTSGVLSQDNANFFWDDSTNRLGIGTATPAEDLHVVGDAIVTGIVYGGTATGDNLDLDPSNATNYTGRVRICPTASDYAGAVAIAFDVWPNGLTKSVAGGNIQAFAFNGMINYAVSSGGGEENIFADGHTSTNSTAAATAFGSRRSFRLTPTFQNAFAVAASMSDYEGMRISPVFSNSGGGTFGISNVRGLRSRSDSSLAAGTTVTTWTHFAADDITLAGGTLNNHVAYDTNVASISGGGTLISYRSQNAAAQMRHAGSARFGSNAAPSATLHAQHATTDIVRATDGTNNLFEVLQLETVVNNAGLATHDFRVEGDTLTHLIFVDASADRVSIGDSTPDNFFTVGTTSQFQVGTDGDLDRIKDVPYSWPAANAAGYLRNDGAGVLSWDASGAGIDHGGLSGLADDDHTQYLLLAGRSGGQDVQGGTATADNLDIDPTSAANYTGFIRIGEGAGDYGTTTPLLVEVWPNGITVGNFAALTGAAIRFRSTITTDTNTALNAINLMLCDPTLTNASGVTAIGSLISFTAKPTLTNSQGAAITVASEVGFQSAPVFSNTGGSTLAAAATAFQANAPSVGSSVTLSTRTGLAVIDATGAGAITTQVGVDLQALDFATTNISLRSSATVTEMRHAGPGVFGQNAPAQIASEILRVHQPTLGNHVTRWESAATNDDPVLWVQQGRATTTDATVTTLMSITLNASNTTLIEARVVGRRTGGAAGTAEDGIGVIVRGAYKMVAGAATALTNGTPVTDFETDDQAAWTATLDTTGATVRVRVTGAANNNITWHATCLVQEVES